MYSSAPGGVSTWTTEASAPRTPPEYLKASDVGECEVEGIGVLSNPTG